MKNGFISVAAATPHLRVADPAYNVRELIRLSMESANEGVRVLVFPELSLTGATCGDLFYNDMLLQGAREALLTYLQETATLSQLSVVGLPLEHCGKLYNVAAVCCGGKLLGIVPKTVLPTRGAPAQAKYFCSPKDLAIAESITVNGQPTEFGGKRLFCCEELPNLKLAVTFGDDLFSPLSGVYTLTAAGATLICCPAASSEQIGALEKRRLSVLETSLRYTCACLYAGAGMGESTTDFVYGGHCLLAELGDMIAEKVPFSKDEWMRSEIDVDTIMSERRKNALPDTDTAYFQTTFSLSLAQTVLTRKIDAHPFVPADPATLSERCETILSIQAAGLAQRTVCAYAQKLVLGISGGLDSTLALLVMARAMDLLGRPRTDIIAVTMPCFGTTTRTKNNATVLCEELGVEFRCVDIFDAVNQHFSDIGHDPNNRNVVYENAQARERTQILMDIANECGGMVVGTGDLSELALGWATYNGDQMSMYGVNADVPKTLVRHMVAHCAAVAKSNGQEALANALFDVVNTPVSPELLPADEKGDIAQKTEDLVGPYEIHDFYLYYMLRYGYSPAKLYRLAKYALGETYDEETLKKWLRVFVRRFFTQQFKRSCMPDGPKVGSVGLSPRGDWQMPSDASAALWLAEVDAL